MATTLMPSMAKSEDITNPTVHLISQSDINTQAGDFWTLEVGYYVKFGKFVLVHIRVRSKTTISGQNYTILKDGTIPPTYEAFSGANRLVNLSSNLTESASVVATANGNGNLQLGSSFTGLESNQILSISGCYLSNE